MKESTFFERYKEILLGIFMLALACFYLYESTFIKTRSTISVSAKAIPEMLGAMVVVLGVLQVIAGVKKLRAITVANQSEGKKNVLFGSTELKDAVPVILTFIIILGYAMVFDRLGFVLSSTLCMFFQMWVLSPKGKFRPGFFFFISAAVAICVYVAFRHGLSLSLPMGVFEGLGI